MMRFCRSLALIPEMPNVAWLALPVPSAVPAFAGPTITYAPTWEGEDDANNYTSVDRYGPRIIAAALAQPGARVLYMPHPRVVNSRDEGVARGHAEIVRLMEQAQAGMMKSWPGSTLREQRQIETGPLTGREFVVAAAGDRFVRARPYLTPQAVYSQIAQGPVSQLDSPLVAQFFESLRFG